MDDPESERATHPAPDTTAHPPEKRSGAPAHNVVPFARNVIPFSRSNYSYPPAVIRRKPEVFVQRDGDDDPGPSAA